MRKLICAILSVIILMMSVSALAETAITTTGTGEVYITADTAVVSLGVTARDKEVLKAQAKVNETIAQICSSLEANGIRKEDISTDMINIYAIYDYDYKNENDQITAYNASVSLAVRVTDMEGIGKIIDLAFEAGANMLNGVTFGASETEQAREDALRAAITDAKAKAEILADACGMKNIRFESVTENASYTYDSGANNVRFDKSTASAAETVVRAAKLCVSASVTVVFEAE